MTNADDNSVIPTALWATDANGLIAPTALARGPWNPEHCHGGPVAAMIARQAEQCETGGIDWTIARLTVELERPCEVGRPLRVERAIERSGKRISLVSVTMSDGDNIVARGRAMRIRNEHVPMPIDITPEAFPATVADSTPETMTHVLGEDPVSYVNTACQYRYANGSWETRGPVDVWIRLAVPVLDGEHPSGLQRVAAAADFGNGVSAAVSWDDYLFINPDLTIHLIRRHDGEWVGMRAVTHLSDMGTGLAESALYDERGRVGRSLQSLLLAPR